MNKLYPFKFRPVFKEKIWGGEKIRTKLGLDFTPLPNCGEAWVLSDVPGSKTKVANGFLKGNTLGELAEVFIDDLLGESVFDRYGNDFPLLVKFIDSNDWLSIQVHPDDELAARRNVGSGKTEMWYILDAEPGSELITGFRGNVDRETYLRHMETKNLKAILNAEKVSAGDVFYIPSGRIHALGPGILLAEIQQSSDTTYRIYDWDRVDNKGNSRELHTELALDAIDFNPVEQYRTLYPRSVNQTGNLADTSYFTTNFLEFDSPVEKDLTLHDSFIAYVCVDGSAAVLHEDGQETLKKGETLLIPAIMERILLHPDRRCKILEVFIRD